MGDLDRDMGKLEGQVEALTKTVSDLAADVRLLRDELAQIRGGWRVVVMLSAMAGGALSWVTTYFSAKH